MKQVLVNPDGSKTYFIELCNGKQRDRPNKTLLLLHGLGADHKMWQPQLRHYAEAGFHLLIPDLFGHGQSSNLKSAQLSEWHNQINWLLQHKAIDQCTLIGVSMGGVIAQSFATRFPQRVEGLVVVDSFGELHSAQEKLLGFSQVAGFALFRLLGHQQLVRAMDIIYRASYAEAARDYFREVSLTVDFRQLLLARRAINRIDVLDQLSEITAPALVMVGTDFGPRFVAINQKIADALPNAKFVVLQQSMDPSNLVNPVAFDRQVLQFLQK